MNELATTTTVTTLNVELQDQDLNIYVLKLNYPANDVTRSDVTEAFDYLLGGESSASGKPILYSRAGSPYTAVGKTQIVRIMTSKEDLV